MQHENGEKDAAIISDEEILKLLWKALSLKDLLMEWWEVIGSNAYA